MTVIPEPPPPSLTVLLLIFAVIQLPAAIFMVWMMRTYVPQMPGKMRGVHLVLLGLTAATVPSPFILTPGPRLFWQVLAFYFSGISLWYLVISVLVVTLCSAAVLQITIRLLSGARTQNRVFFQLLPLSFNSTASAVFGFFACLARVLGEQ
ncbi:MAG: hypothetical protein HY304_03085 [candidate division Zixibacteria bacterium]|nr:hypothetical protein [candidate division Zixibacteria bacterium]